MADISKIKTPDGTTYDIKDASARSTADGKVSKSGDTMTGKLTLKAGQYTDAYNSGSLDLKNSNIDGVNSIYTADASENAAEGIHFYRDATHVDSIHATNGHLYFTPNRALGSAGTSYEIAANGLSGLKEAYLEWGGKNFSASYGCIDAAMIPDLGANRFAFLKSAGITIEYSNDGGSTWSDYAADNTSKTGLFANGTNFYLGKHATAKTSSLNDQLRVTIATSEAGIYTNLNKIAIYMSTNGNTVQVKLERALQSTPDNYTTHLDWTGISGWSGWNILNISGITTYGNTPASQYGRLRFTFRQTAVTTTYAAATISRIMGFGGVGWTVPSNMAKNGHLYSYDNSQNATFPAKVTATQIDAPASKLQTYKQGSTTTTWGTSYPVYAQWIDSTNVKLKCDNYTTKVDNVTGTVAVENGGTGKTTAKDAANQFMNALDTGSSTPADADYYISQYVNGGTTTTTYHRRPMSALWAYIKSKIESIVLSTSTSSTSTTTAATSSAVKTAYDLANTANGTANSALSGVNGNLIYDQTFTISNGVATFAPHVYQKGQEVTTNYAKSCFVWKYRTIDGTEVSLTTNNDRGCTVTISGMGYGGHVIGIFTPA